MNFDDDARRSTRLELFDAMSRHGMMLPCRPVPSMLIEAMQLSAERRLEMSEALGLTSPRDAEKTPLTSHPVRSRMASLLRACGAILNAWKGSADHSVR